MKPFISVVLFYIYCLTTGYFAGLSGNVPFMIAVIAFNYWLGWGLGVTLRRDIQ